MRSPWSNKSIDRLGQRIRLGESYDEELYLRFIVWSGDIIDQTQAIIHSALNISRDMDVSLSVAGSNLIERIPVHVTGRPKTLDTTREKLRRMPTYK